VTLTFPTRVVACIGMLVAAGCTLPSDAARPEPSSLGLYVGDVHVNRFSSLALFPGTELHFTVRLTDVGGRAVTDLRPLLTSRNVGTLTVDTAGVVRVAGLGASWIVGSVLTHGGNVLADSTFVNVVCLLQAQPAIALTIVDSVSGQSSALRGISVSIRDGLLRDTVFISSAASVTGPLVVGLANERKGTYDLTVSAAGYRGWTRSGVVVGSDLCHVATVALTARLQPL
jgi:hypothetical protein